MKFLTITFIAILAFSLNANSQNIISKFTWEGTSVTSADIGPDATSVSSSAKVSNGGNNGSKGLNPSLPKKNVELKLPASYYNVEGIDVSFDFRKEEPNATFIEKGNNLKVAMNGGKLRAKYKYIDAVTNSIVTVNSGNAYTFPTDGVFYTIRFTYDPTTGVGELYVNGAQVWTNDGTDNSSLDISNTDDMIVGADLDGAGTDVVVFDNLIIKEIENVPAALPVELMFFNAESNDNGVEISWATASEENNAYWTVERSDDQKNWEVINIVAGHGTTNIENNYTTIDNNPFAGTTYYRLTQTDNDGKSETFEVIAVTVESNAATVKTYPNPVNTNLYVELNEAETADVMIYTLSGELVMSVKATSSFNTISVSDINQGLYLLKVVSNNQILAAEKLLIK